MTKRYITRRISQLYELSTGREGRMVLIFGDEVQVAGPVVNGRVLVEFRGRDDCILENQLGLEPAL